MYKVIVTGLPSDFLEPNFFNQNKDSLKFFLIKKGYRSTVDVEKDSSKNTFAIFSNKDDWERAVKITKCEDFSDYPPLRKINPKTLRTSFFIRMSKKAENCVIVVDNYPNIKNDYDFSKVEEALRNQFDLNKVERQESRLFLEFNRRQDAETIIDNRNVNRLGVINGHIALIDWADGFVKNLEFDIEFENYENCTCKDFNDYMLEQDLSFLEGPEQGRDVQHAHLKFNKKTGAFEGSGSVKYVSLPSILNKTTELLKTDKPRFFQKKMKMRFSSRKDRGGDSASAAASGFHFLPPFLPSTSLTPPHYQPCSVPTFFSQKPSPPSSSSSFSSSNFYPSTSSPTFHSRLRNTNLLPPGYQTPSPHIILPYPSLCHYSNIYPCPCTLR